MADPVLFPADASASDFEATPPMPIDPGGNTTEIVVQFGDVIPGEERTRQAGDFPYVLDLPPFTPIVQDGFNQSSQPPFAGPWVAPARK